MSPLLSVLVPIAALAVLGLGARLMIALVGGKLIGAQALAKQPDTIRLVACDKSYWRNEAAADKLAGVMLAAGSLDAGTYRIPELPGVVLRLIGNPKDRISAYVYEHPRAGHWVELVSRYPDGTSFHVSTSRTAALNPRPGHPVLQLGGMDPASAWKQMLASRPPGTPSPVAVETMVREFEAGYADFMAYRKTVGVSTGEVVRIATRKAA